MALPAEVRNLVFDFLIESESLNDSVPHCLRLRFLLACRQIHHETCVLAFEKMQWRVRNLSRLRLGLAVLRPQKRRAIQSVTLLAQALGTDGRVYLRSRIEAPVMQAPRPSMFWGAPPLTLVSVTLALRRLRVLKPLTVPPTLRWESRFLLELPRHIKTLKRMHVLTSQNSRHFSRLEPRRLVKDLIELVAQRPLTPRLAKQRRKAMLHGPPLSSELLETYQVPADDPWSFASPVPLSWLAPDRLPFSLSSPLTPMTLAYEGTCERAGQRPRVVDLFVTDDVPWPLFYDHVTFTHR